jgi:tRNA threonylcarbamoyladenosine biosynthesis protein TsaB
MQNTMQPSPLILGIETSTKICSVALHDSGNLLGEIILTTEKAHAEMLTVSISALFEQCKITGSSLAAIALSEGPGSYTGLRIGSSTAKGLCFAYDLPLIALPTLSAMSAAYSEQIWQNDFLFIPMIDARRSEVFAQVFDFSQNALTSPDSVVVDENSFENYLQDKKAVFFGDGALKCQKIIKHPNALFAPDFIFSARMLGKTAFQYFLQKKFADTAYFEPFYLKEYQAVKSKNPVLKTNDR